MPVIIAIQDPTIHVCDDNSFFISGRSTLNPLIVPISKKTVEVTIHKTSHDHFPSFLKDSMMIHKSLISVYLFKDFLVEYNPISVLVWHGEMN